MQSLGIIGCGFVGKAVLKGFSSFTSVMGYDVDPKKTTHSFEDVIKADFVFVCLPTPMEHIEGGKCDLTYIENCFVELNKQECKAVIAIKSTVPIGTTKRLSALYPDLKIVHNPEFLTAKNALVDFLTPARNIVGGENLEAVNSLAKLYESRFPGVPVYTMTSQESESVKYFCNCFLATKLTFFNEMKLLADKLNMNWDVIIEGMLSDGRIAKSHYQTPSKMDGLPGYSGSCFPKDINALITTFCENGLDPKLLKAGWEQNKAIRPVWDWNTYPSAVSKKE